jgi:isopropylmalate/homocitrate/citramalate synthase
MTRDPAVPQDLIHDWNEEHLASPSGTLTFDDESLRDGLQSPSVSDPPQDDKLAILHLMERLGIHSADVGLPAAGPRAYADTLVLAQETVSARMKLRPNAAARTLVKDIQPIAEISAKIGRPVEVAMFVGSSPIRFYTENWNMADVLAKAEEAVTFAVQNGLPVMFVTEDTTRATPEAVRALYQTAIRAGARRITVADTVGHSTPSGVRSILRYVRQVAEEAGGPEVLIDWHGHNDRGLGVINSITAALSGANQIHGTALGIGERCGNAAMDQILVNLKLLGLIENDLSALLEYCERVSRAVGIEIPVNYPVLGRDAFRTATGVHAAAVVKAARRGDFWLADRVYSGVPAEMVGRTQLIEVGPMSGVANVSYWLSSRGYDPAPELIDRIFQAAKKAKAVLTDAEIAGILAEAGAKPTA